MSEILKSITIECLDSINSSLANRLRQLGAQLKTNEDNGTTVSYWIDVELSDGQMYLSADNGFDISSEVKVNVNDMEAIRKFINSGP